MVDPTREHLFISYASEDWILAEWLTRKLTSEGFRVWCDRFKLLGGESYPRDIDLAIKTRTFRLLALISKASLSKENPLKERTLALNIAREKQIDFLIPLLSENLKPTELDWMTSDLTYIPFYDNWVDGLRTLLKKLVSIDTPRPLNNGRHIAASTYLTEDVIKNTSENIYLNLLSILNLPDGLKRFEIHRQLDSLEYRKLSAVWPFYKTSRSNIYSFQSPPPKLPIDITLSPSGGLAWGSFPKIDGTKTSNIISSLLLKSLYWKCHEKGLKFSEPLKLHFFPVGLLHGNKIPLVDTSNRRTYVLATSERRHRSQEKIKTWRYHLCPTFQVRQDLLDDFTIQLSTRIYITDAHGQPLAPRSSNARRKALCKSWWNYEWLNRHLAICSFLADQSNEIRIGRYTNEQIIISSQLLTLQSPYGINEEMLKGIPPHIGTHDEGLESKEEV